MTAALPLAGITVVDLGQIYSGPYATFLMARAGARVIKVEPPKLGETLRRRVSAGSAIPFSMLNADKESVTLNLKSPVGRELLIEMVKRADVLVENFAPGTLDRLGVGWEVLRRENRRLIYGSGSGYGVSGPARDYPAMDLTVQAMSGVMSVTGMPDGPPLKAGPAITDFNAGVHLFAGIMTALVGRAATGEGRFVEVAMQDAIVMSMASNIALWCAAGEKIPTRTGNRHGALAESPYNVYPSKDGHIAIVCPAPRHWQGLTEAMGRPELAEDPRYRTPADRIPRMDEVDSMISAWTSGLGKYEAFDILSRHRVPSAPVREIGEVMQDEAMHQRGMLSFVEHPELGRIVAPRSPIRFDFEPGAPVGPAPTLGRDNEEVYLGWLGRSPDELADWTVDGTV